jgi:catechol 2,3-dioxygenase-like lactoylglutathione lyase family enzyme
VPDLDAAIAWYSNIFGLTVEHHMGGRTAALCRPVTQWGEYDGTVPGV